MAAKCTRIVWSSTRSHVPRLTLTYLCVWVAVQHSSSACDRQDSYVARDMASQVIGKVSGSCYEWSLYVRGYVEYKKVWTPTLGEMLQLKVEPMNPRDQFAVAVIYLDGMVVGHIPKHASRAVSFFLKKAGNDESTWQQHYRGVGLGVEIPCKYQVLRTSSLRR